ncbi:uncharacterized protein LOC141904395 [Tubulanus polymorphus]|uniref:uncharacterized protein LOC141904395 n=1 Tax=Tubulanus polymorphus TaxID=672921 RepID=UPI003DA6A110
MPHAIGGARDIKTNILSTPASCKIITYISYTSAFIASWIVVIFTAERFLRLKLDYCSLTRKCRLVTLSIFSVLGGILMVPVLTSFNIDDDGIFIECLYFPSNEGLFSYFGPFFLYCVVYTVPVSLVWLGNGAILVAMYRNRNLNVTMLESDEGQNGCDRILKNRKIFIQLIVVSTMFLVFTTPAVILSIWQCTIDYEINVNKKYGLRRLFGDYAVATGDFLYRFVFLNNCFNYVVYILTVDWFRSDARAIVCPKLTGETIVAYDEMSETVAFNTEEQRPRRTAPDKPVEPAGTADNDEL